MENFIVSARKYRPLTFDTVVGQEMVTSTLKNAIANDQLAQAFLFCGPRGVGKTTCARILAKTINCENISADFAPCDECVSCKSFSEGASLNIYELDAASNNSVEDIRQLVDQVRIPPQSGLFKVYIIDEVHMLSNAAFNAFLKTLEEPPPYAKFILATTEKHKILPTILSRCQIFDFKRIEIKDITTYLEYVAKKEGVSAEKEALHLIAEKADGALRDALSIFDQIVSATARELSYKNVAACLNVLDYDYFFELSEYLVQKDISGILMLIHKVLARGFDGHHLLLGLGKHFRNLLMSKDGKTANLLEVSDEVRNRYIKQASLFDTVLLVRSLDIIGRADTSYRISQDKRLYLELNILQIAALHFPESENEKKKVGLPPVVKEKSDNLNVDKEKRDCLKQNNVVARTAKKALQTNPALNPEKRRTGVLSIRNFHKKQSLDKSVENNPDAVKRLQAFSQQELNIAWSRFITENRGEAKSFVNAIAGSHPKILDAYIIGYEVQNELIEKDVINLTKLLAFLKDELE